MPGWHQPVAQALAHRTGPGGGRRTRSSIESVWMSIRGFLRFVAEYAEPPPNPGLLAPAHLEGYYQQSLQTASRESAWYKIRELRLLFDCPATWNLLTQETRDYLGRRAPVKRPAQSGYSDGELNRIIAAARREVARIRDRIAAGENLLASYLDDLASVAPPDIIRAAQLAGMASTGLVPKVPAAPLHHANARLDCAEQLFLTHRDMVPLMTLLVAVTGWNAETVKELPAQHRVLEQRAVELQVVKRRRGRRSWYSTVTWEIGPPGRELHTPGGLYLLLLRLTARSRVITQTGRAWSIWRNGTQSGVEGTDEHFDPFARRLSGAWFKLDKWVAAARIVADDGEPLRLNLRRLRTSVEVRRTKQLGGHLPSVVRSNTIPVLFRHYLRGDPTVTAWAEEIISDAVLDAEQAALAAHERALRTAGGSLHIVTATQPDAAALQQAGIDAATAADVTSGKLNTAWTACVDRESHPATGRPCQASFLDCFHCGNCLITRDHLPRLLALLTAMNQRRAHMGEDAWWQRYGPAWAAIRHDILGRFSPAEVEQAKSIQPGDALLDLVENPWETQ